VNKYVIAFLLLLITAAAFGQKKSKVLLVSSSRSEGVKVNGVDLIKVYNGQWRQDFSTMRSDSAYFHQDQNSFDAFGHVVIHQGDTLNIYADKLHYDGNTKIADLNDNVVMIDKSARLTTNHFTYNTATRIGTYVDGGKIVDKDNTLTSQNGYYFAGSHDAYFRYNVVCVTTDARIITDTMRYNSQSKINYFYGLTHIYGKKDKDTLDTEYGTYNTNTEEANFTKNNMYRQGTKSLKGDTLYYDRLKGIGRATKHVIFNDNEQKTTIYGGLATYVKANDLTVVTRDPYIIMVVEEKDTSKSNSLAKTAQQKTVDSLSRIAAAKNPKGKSGKSTLPGLKPPANTMPLQQKMLDSASKRLTMPVIDSFSRKLPKVNTDSLAKQAAAVSQTIDKATQKKIRDAAKNLTPGKLDTGKLKSLPNIPIPKTDTSHIKHDSVYISADTIKTRILTRKEEVTIQEQERLSHIRDTTKRPPSTVYKKRPKYIELDPPPFPKDTGYYHTQYFGPPPKKPAPKKAKASTAPKKPAKIDSTFLNPPVVMADTAHVRILMAFHSAKIFKSDLQAVADSIFYSSSDSTIRCYTKPMLWTQGSQLSGDTINLIMKHQKLEKMDMYPNAFIVNVEKNDSTHFNQISGKRMRGFFANDQLRRVVIDGNAETIYFVHDSATNKVTDMQKSFSSGIWVLLANKEVVRSGFITKPENRVIPITKVKDDDKILKGFIWKPKDRPVSKESVLPSYNKKKKAAETPPAKAPVAGEPRPKKLYNSKDGKSAPGKAPAGVKAAVDSIKAAPADTNKNQLLKNLPALKSKADSVIKAGKDTTKSKAPVSKPVN
jgi:lipopolysaccharide export system protein LptA